MRNFKLSALFIIGLLYVGIVSAQVRKQAAPIIRCGTETVIEQRFQEDPAFRAEYLRKSASASRTTSTNGTSRLNTLTTPVVIPVIVHVVLPNPSIITEDQIDYLLNRLNIDYSGLNPDSTNGTLFYPVRGHSLLRFTRARRTPAGTITNGIERRVGGGAIALTTYQAIKHTAVGGLDPWDVTQYYNLWVGDGGATGLLGIAPAIGVGNQTETTASATGIDGVCVDYRGISNGCFSYAPFALGRTAVHEIGHNFGLYHTFSGCADGADFAQPTPAGQTLPPNLVGPSPADDTPGQNAPTSGCPTGPVASAGCTAVPNPPGKMYQNYMDYTDDPCYSMFTKNQVERMHYMLETYRPGYLTTQGANPPTGFPSLDAGINAIVSPGGSEFNNATCTITNYPTPNCPGSFTPRLSIINVGSTTLTSVTVSLTVGANPAVVTTFPVNLTTNKIATVVFPAQVLGLGTTAITFTITAVNGAPDAYTANNSISTSVNVSIASLPFTQNFSTASPTAFPPANMTVVNAANNTWVYNAAGNGNPGSAFIDNYNNNFPGQTDDLRTIPLAPLANATAQDSVIISFDLAHKNYTFAPYDILSVLVSNDCGATFTSVYSKSGPTLATAGASGAAYTAPIATDWRRERISIGGSFLTGGPIIVAFRNTNQYGNNIFIDNINIVKKVDRDLSISAINSPAANLCAPTVVPQVVVTNNGGLAVTSFKIGYRIGTTGAFISQSFTQTIAPGASATITLTTPVTAVTGANTFTAFTADPVAGGITGDQQTGNDTLSKAFNLQTIFPLPFNEGFEGTTFPPVGWMIFNPGANSTWVRDNHGNNSSFSAKIDNYTLSPAGQIDALQTPPLRTTGTDSIIVSFDYAHKNYPGFNDNFQVLMSTDCGGTFTSFFTRTDPALATAGSSTAAYTNPLPADWVRVRVSIPTASATGGNVIIRFQNLSGLGNNFYLDNINIISVFRRDLQLLSINQPGNVLCTTATTPAVTVRNAGVETITAYKVAYSIDNGTPVTTTFTGLTLVAGATQNVNLTAATLAIGTHTLKVYSLDPVSTSGTGDNNGTNDTLTKVVSVVSTQAAPLVEGFENSVFPPVGWALNNIDGATTWQRTISAPRVTKTDTASAYIKNFNYTNNGSRDELYSPQVTYGGVDSVSLSFDVAAVTRSYPGSTAIPLDTLEVFVTNDCGTTLTSIYKKWGNDLQTVNDPNYPQTNEFIPSSRNQWRTEKIDLSTYVTRSPIQLVFRNTTNAENNIFLDNINLSTKTLPAQLKAQGYLIYPNPFITSFTIQHYLTPTELRSVAVYNSVGQRMYAQSYNAGGASSLMQIDMSRYASGLYTVVLSYTNRTISQKIIKSR